MAAGQGSYRSSRLFMDEMYQNARLNKPAMAQERV
jgi:hypothetical protein